MFKASRPQYLDTVSISYLYNKKFDKLWKENGYSIKTSLYILYFIFLFSETVRIAYKSHVSEYRDLYVDVTSN